MPVRIRKVTVELEPLGERQPGFLSFSLRVDLHNNQPPLFTRNSFPINDFKSDMSIFLDIIIREVEVQLERQFSIERRSD